MKSAVAIGGLSALAAAKARGGLTGTRNSSRLSKAERDNRQHAWTEYLPADDRGIPAPPSYHVLLFLNYEKRGEPEPEDRFEMELALRQLERAFEWGGNGLLFTVNYSLDYFDRFDESLPSGVDLRPDQDVIDAIKVPGEDPVPESYDLFIDLASNNASNVLAAEEALWGNVDDINGVRFDETFEGIFDKPQEFPDRRTGFVGTGIPAEQVNNDDIPEDAPLSMGFQSVFTDNIPREDDVSMIHNQRLGDPMPPGMFAQGTIQHASRLSIDLQSWYDQDKSQRTKKMFSPHHDEEDVGDVGNELGQRSGTDELPMRDDDADDDIARRTQRDAEENGLVGHAQKLARARFDLSRRDTDGQSDQGSDDPPEQTDETTILRRDFNTTDAVNAEAGQSGLHFLALMRFNGYMVYVRRSMNGVGFSSDEEIVNDDENAINHDDVDIPLENDGFLNFITAHRRGNYMMPPLSLRSLPTARSLPAQAFVNPFRNGKIDMGRRYMAIAVTKPDPTHEIDADTVRFGDITEVNQGRGAEPIAAHLADRLGRGERERELWLFYRTADLELGPGDEQARLFGYRETGEPFALTVDVNVEG